MALRISHLGIRSDEFIIASESGKQCKGSLLQIRGLYPPYRQLSATLPDTVIRDELNNYDFFEHLSERERRLWFTANSTDVDDLYISDCPGLQVKVHSLSGEMVSKSLTPEQINYLIQGNPDDEDGYWPFEVLYNMFPRKPGSKAKRHTLIFRPGNWTLKTKDLGLQEFNGFNLVNNQIAHGPVKCPDGGKLLTFDYMESKFCLSYERSSTVLSMENLYTLAARKGLDVKQMTDFSKLTSWFPPSMYKSLIQKIIRTRSAYVEYASVEYPAREALIATFFTLLLHKGAFVHDIQRFVSGMESATKRLAVSICEDSYLEDGSILTSMLKVAYIAQNGTSKWYPSIELVDTWVTAALYSLETPLIYDYDWHNASNSVREWTSWSTNYILLNAIRSFESDISMLSSIADNNGRPREVVKSRGDRRVMPLIHCLDQHSFTEIAHYIKPLESFTAVFELVWQRMVSWNPRLEKYTDWDINSNFDDFQLQVRRAQRLVWISKIYEPREQQRGKKNFQFEYTLDDSWLSAFIGPYECKVSGSLVIVVLNPNDISNFIVVRRPSRDNKDPPELTESEKKEAVDSFKYTLSKGFKLSGVPDTLQQLKGLYVYYSEDNFYIGTSSGVREWGESKVLSIIFPIDEYELSKDLVEQSLLMTGSGIHVDGNKTFTEYLNNVDKAILRRSLLYINNYKSEIELYHIGRDGKGTEYAVSVLDVGVNELLCTLCCLYPGALVKKGSKFKVKSGPLFWSICSVIRQKSEIKVVLNNSWFIEKEDTRALWDHQVEAVQKLLDTRGKGQKLRIVWVEMGLGKSLIVFTYIVRLIKLGLMPKYCLYTLPPSAIKTVTEECLKAGLKYVHLDMRVSAGGSKGLVPGVVNFIYHDHLRMSDLDDIREYASEMLFINDEFHKTVASKTIRTSTALELSKLSGDCIAMSGTIIRDSNTKELISWLENAVKFEVTEKNYWVAIASLVSSKVQTKVVVERSVISPKMTDDETSRYLLTIPESLGGKSTKIDFKASVLVSYEAVTREIVDQVMFYLSHSIGSFVVAKNKEHQKLLQSLLLAKGLTSVALIENNHFFNLTPESLDKPQVVITTPQHSEGYNMTAFMILIQGVYFSNQATRDQLEKRINRIGQIAPVVRIITIHAGILSYIHEKYEKVRSLAKVISGFATDIGVSDLQVSDV